MVHYSSQNSTKSLIREPRLNIGIAISFPGHPIIKTFKGHCWKQSNEAENLTTSYEVIAQDRVKYNVHSKTVN